jgi:hypothetical protein
MATTDSTTGFVTHTATDVISPLYTYVNDVVNPINTWAKDRMRKNYVWADATARAAQTGMLAGSLGYQTDTGVDYRYDGSAWVLLLSGLNLLKPTSVTGGTIVGKGGVTVSAASAVSINGVFSSTFGMYRVNLNLTTSGAASLTVTLRVAGTDAATNYDRQSLVGSSAAASASQTLAATSWTINSAIAGAKHSGNLDLFDPGTAVATTGTSAIASVDNPMTTSASYRAWALGHRTATAYDGITITASTGTITGAVSVMGFYAG